MEVAAWGCLVENLVRGDIFVEKFQPRNTGKLCIHSRRGCCPQQPPN